MAINFGVNNDTLSRHDKAKAILFARWMSMTYSSSQLNENDGIWWLKAMKHFEKTVLPNYIENGSYDDTLLFLESNESKDLTSICNKCGVEIDFNKTICDTCEAYDLPF